MSITEDFSIYFDTKTGMAESIKYTLEEFAHVSSKSVDLDCIFDKEYLSKWGIGGKTPMVSCDESDLPSDYAPGDKIRRGTIDYTVKEFEPDGTGFMILILAEDDSNG